MVTTQRALAFASNEPELALKDLHTAKGVLSLKGLPYPSSPTEIGFLGLRLVLDDKTHTTVLVDRVAGAALLALLQTFESVDWKVQLSQGGAVQH